MATSELAGVAVDAKDRATTAATTDARNLARRALAVLASLRLTVVLFAMSILLVFLGTLAQKDHGVWYVVDYAYFRVWFAHIELQTVERLVQMFRPVEWNLSGYLYFPGGKMIGLALMLNLLAAHSVRFKIAAHGRRLAVGLAIIAAGVVATWLAIHSGMNNAVESELSPYFCNVLWHSLRAVVGAIALVGAYAVVVGWDQMRRVDWWLLLAVDAVFCVMAGWLFLHPDTRLDDSGLRILWQLVKGLAAGLILLVGCVLVFRKRAGVVLLHGGVALLMLGELLTGLTAQESQMSIAEGATTNYAQDIRSTELAVVDHAAADVDRVTVVPEHMLENNVGRTARIDNKELPFTVQVHRWLPNSALRMLPAGQTGPATTGPGERILAEALAQGTGMDSGVDTPAAYVELFAKDKDTGKDTGESLGTYLVAQQLPEQAVDVAGQNYGLALRFKRVYYPYSLTLKDFRFDRYAGTNIAKNYSSLVQLRDPTRHVDREVLIWMNNPLRYAGTTFYQSSFDAATEKTTVLQVVSNASWMIPYVACMLVLTGMLAHFGVSLVRFSRRRVQEEQIVLEPVEDPQHAKRAGRRAPKKQGMALVFPAIVLVVFGGYLLSKTRMPESPSSEMQIYEFAKLPLVYQGRVKPYDTLARNSLQILSNRQELLVPREDGSTEKLPAIRWLLDAISGAPAAEKDRVFRIDNLDLIQTLGLEQRPGSFRYSLAELRPGLGELDNQIRLAAAEPEASRSLYQKRVLQLANKLNFYGGLTQSFQFPNIENVPLAQQEIARLQSSSVPHAVPPQTVGGHWQMLVEAEFELWKNQNTGGPRNPAAIALAKMLIAYANDDTTTFNRELASYRTLLANYEQQLDDPVNQTQLAGLASSEILSQNKINFETFYNQFSPFYYAAVLYLVAFVLGVLSWLAWSGPLRRASMWLLWFTFAVHTLALVGRIYISGRPPVTNLYSSAIFIGWGCVLLSLVFELVYRLGLGNIVAAVVGFLTLLVAHFLSLDGDTFVVLQAVLDTQFWLTTHVVCITLGYAATFLAGTFGITYVLTAHVFPVLDQGDRRTLVRMIYGTLCFAIFFSFIGTVLGGLWADDSWGRFWGWDPKENGALIIVLYNALVLHARWGALVKERGLAVLAIGGNIVTTWSWFGTNALGVGLHAYGGSERNTAMWLLVFVASQLVLIGLGMMPQAWLRMRATGKNAG